MSDIDITGELNIIKKYINQKDIVFDIGGNLGHWSMDVLKYYHKANIYVFEPIPELYAELSFNLAYHKRVKIINRAVSDKDIDNNVQFYVYRSETGLSTLHRRALSEKKFNVPAPEKIIISTVKIDTFCEQNNITHIDFLKIDTEGNELNVLKGAYNMLKANKIKNIQFEYGGAFLDANISLFDIIKFISEFNFNLYKIQPNDLIYITKLTPKIEDYVYTNFLLTNNNFTGNNNAKVL